jgi:hypothetical protein
MTGTTSTRDDAPHAGCHSCGIPIESGRYCSYCTDAEGHAVVTGALRTHGRLAGPARSRGFTRSSGRRNPWSHGHHAGLARPPGCQRYVTASRCGRCFGATVCLSAGDRSAEPLSH